jgi:hypothetical protein
VANSAGIAPFRVAGIPCPLAGFQPQNFLFHLFVVLGLEHLGLLLFSKILSYQPEQLQRRLQTIKYAAPKLLTNSLSMSATY